MRSKYRSGIQRVELNQTEETPVLKTEVIGSNVGYSTDDKEIEVPSARKGDDFFELDTGDVYIYDGSIWVVI